MPAHGHRSLSVEYKSESWMSYVISRKPELVNRTLSEWQVPGSHDTATYDLQSALACKTCAGVDTLGPPLVVTNKVCDPLGVLIISFSL